MQNIDMLVKQIEKELYKLDYDDLSDYLKGVRDFINLIKRYEDSESITEYILEQITNNKIKGVTTMTDEALNILVDKSSITLELELYKDKNGNNCIYIGSEDSSGCKYPVRTAKEIGKIVTEYFENYVL